MANSTLPLPLGFHNGEEPLTVEITLTNGCVTIVDAIDGDLLNQRWYPANKNGRIYVWGKIGERVNGQLKTIHLHRVIFERIIGHQLDRREIVDHWDNNPLNNRRSNLRLANKIRNAQNAKMRCDNSSGYKGVTKSFSKWSAEIKVNGQRLRLGRFDSPEEAYEAYCKAALEYFGEFARFE